MTTTVTRSYEIQISFDPFKEDHNYSRTDTYPLRKQSTTFPRKNVPIESREEVIALAEKNYSDTGDYTGSWVAYWLHEHVTTLTEEDVTVDGITRHIRTEQTVTEKNFYAKYRTAENYHEKVTKPSQEYTQKLIDSGEQAIQDARMEEYKENSEREERGEAPVYTAEIAYFTFKEMTVPDYMLEAEELRLHPKPIRSKLRALVGL